MSNEKLNDMIDELIAEKDEDEVLVLEYPPDGVGIHVHNIPHETWGNRLSPVHNGHTIGSFFETKIEQDVYFVGTIDVVGDRVVVNDFQNDE